MRRRQVLLSTTTVITGLAGCNGNRTGEQTESETERSTESPPSSETQTTSETPASVSHRETPPAEFEQKWSFDTDDDWTERYRLTQYPDSDESVDWTPSYARSAVYAHIASREEFASAVDTPDVPRVGCAILSKWAFSTESPNTPVDFVDEVRGWFMDQFENFHFDFGSPENVEPYKSELESGQEIGRDLYELEADTGQLDAPFRATVDETSVEVNRVSYGAGGVLLGFVGSDDHVGFLAGGVWPVEDSVTLHTVESGEIEVPATVSGDSWDIEISLLDVLEGIPPS